MNDEAFAVDVAALAAALRARGWRLASAESCTGGLLAAACTEAAGASDWFERGFVTYSNAAKSESLGVPTSLLATHGAVSEPVAIAMATGSLAHSAADLSMAITGIAGPGGGTAEKPVGTVWFAIAARSGPPFAWRAVFGGDRGAIRRAAVGEALRALERRAVPSPASKPS